MIDFSSRPLRVFLCHSSGDKPIVRELYQKLANEGWFDVWLDEEKLYPGQDWNYEIELAVEAADVIIVCLSNNSVTKEGYVQRELRFALDIALEKPEGTIFVIPLRLDNCEPPRRLRGWQYADYFPENLRTRGYQRLLESLKVRAKHLGLFSDMREKSLTPAQISPLPVTSPTSQPATPYPPVGPNPPGLAARLSAIIKRFSIWKYVRLIVIFLLISGFFGPWFEITSCGPAPQEGGSSEPIVSLVTGPEEYSELIASDNARVLIALVLGALFLLTLLRLIPWKIGKHSDIVSLERLVAGLAPIAISIERFSSTFTILGPTTRLLWGFWLTTVGVYLAAINLLFENITSLQKGQKWPRWARWLAISIIFALILPWLAIGLIWLWIQYGS